MDIKRNCPSSPLIDYNNPITSTPRNRPPPIFSSMSNLDNIHAFDVISLVNVHTSEKSDLLHEQFRLEHEVTYQSSIETQDSFIDTYSSLQTILLRMQLKIASIFLEETEYLKRHEKKLEQEEKSLTEHVKELNAIEIERKYIEKEFVKLKDRLETAVIQVINFQTDGVQILHTLFSESRQIDEQLSALLCQCLASLCRSRTIVDSKITEFSQKSTDIQSELIGRQNLIRNTQSSIAFMLELVNTLNQLNIEHSHTITITTTDCEKKYQEFTELANITKSHLDINKELNEIRLLERQKSQLEKELLEQTILLENISNILGKAMNN